MNETREPVDVHAGLLRHQAGDLAGAHAIYRAVLAREPDNPDALHLLGVIAYQTGDLAGAEDLMSRAVARQPDAPDYRVNLGNVLKDAGRLPEAIASYRAALALRPEHADTHFNLGLALQRSGDPAAAEASFRHALHIAPDHASALYNLGSLLHDRGLADEAERCYRGAIAAQPGFAPAVNALGQVLQEQGDADGAREHFRRAAALDPNLAEARNNLAGALLAAGDVDGAIAEYRQAHALRPDLHDIACNLAGALRRKGEFAEAVEHYRAVLDGDADNLAAVGGLGTALQAMGRTAEAVDLYEAVLARHPDYAEGLNNLGLALQKLGRREEAETAFRRSVAADPGFAEAWGGLGLVLHELHRPDEAIEVLGRAISLKPDFFGAYNNLGNVLYGLGRKEEAQANYLRATEIAPDYAEAYYNRGLPLMEQARLEEAAQCFRRAVELQPDFRDAHGNLLFLLNYLPDIEPETLLAEYRRWGDHHARPLLDSARGHDNDTDPDRRLRVAYVSPDFRRHSASPFIEPLLAHHHENSVEVYAYSQVSAPDAVTERFARMVDHFTPIVDLDDAALAERVRADRIDILVDLAGHTRSSRLLAFARKPAPVQVTWLGFGYTTGMEAMDYFIADPHFVPPGFERLFVERVFRLPRTLFAYRPNPEMPEPGPLPALDTGHLTFGCFSRSVRLNDRVVALWAALLRRMPDARLVLNTEAFLEPQTRDLFWRRFEAQGVPRERIDLIFTSPQPVTWAAYNRIDIALDPFPHNGGTTTFEALWMGVPVISLLDRPPLGRFGATILTNAGLPDWIAGTPEAYVEIAVRAATDLPALAALRAGLRARIEDSPLRDEEGFARAMEAAYREMWRRWCAGQGRT